MASLLLVLLLVSAAPTQSTGQVIVGGISSPVGSEQTVTLNLGSQTYQAQVAADGSWSVTVPAQALQELQELP